MCNWCTAEELCRNWGRMSQDEWAYDNQLGFRNWMGPHPLGVKDAALVPHKYFFSAEINLDNYEEAFRTMKRAILANE